MKWKSYTGGSCKEHYMGTILSSCPTNSNVLELWYLEFVGEMGPRWKYGWWNSHVPSIILCVKKSIRATKYESLYLLTHCGLWLVAWQQAITWTNVDPDLCHPIASLGQMSFALSCFAVVGIDWFLSGVPDFFDRNKILSGGDCPACRTSLIATRFWVVVICPIIKCLTVLEFSFILFDLCLFIIIFNFILNYVPIVTFWMFTYHKIWILLIIFCFIWNYWIIYFLTCLEVFWSVVS